MHEYSIVQTLMDRIEVEAEKVRAVEVKTVELRIGKASGVEIDLLSTAFETFRHGSLCANAELRIESIAPIWRCPKCGSDRAAGDILRCPRCLVPARLVEGDEIILQRIEMEAA